MTSPFRNFAQQMYLSIAPIGIIGGFLVHGFRKNEKWSEIYTWRSAEKVPDNVIDRFDAEFTDLIMKNKKKFKNAKFSVSCIDNLEARTYGSFLIVPGAEFQVPVISTIDEVKTLKSKYPNLLDLVKELDLKGTVDTNSIPDDKLEKILLNDAAKHFFYRREITQAESLSHMVVPMAIGAVAIFLGYPVFKVFALGMGPWVALVVTGTVAVYSAFHLLKTEAKQRTLSMDRRIIEGDKSVIAGAKAYLKARIAFCKLAYEFGDNQTKKGFDEQGNCRSQQASYVERLKEVVDFEEKEEQKVQAVNFRTL